MSDRLLSLAQDARRAGYAVTAEHLLHLADFLFEEVPDHGVAAGYGAAAPPAGASSAALVPARA